MLNNITLMGRVASDLELVNTNNGKQIIKFTVAVTRDFKNANGEYEADFIRCMAFGTTAEHIAKYSHKGKLITLNGTLQTGSYENATTGQKVFTTDVIINKCDVFTGNPKEQQNDYTQNNFTQNNFTPTPPQGQIQNNDLPW